MFASNTAASHVFIEENFWYVYRVISGQYFNRIGIREKAVDLLNMYVLYHNVQHT
jgi:hypothetical protein